MQTHKCIGVITPGEVDLLRLRYSEIRHQNQGLSMETVGTSHHDVKEAMQITKFMCMRVSLCNNIRGFYPKPSELTLYTTDPKNV